MRKVIFILGPSALPLAKRLSAMLFAEIHGPEGVEGIKHSYTKATDHLVDLFNQGAPSLEFVPLAFWCVLLALMQKTNMPNHP